MAIPKKKIKIENDSCCGGCGEIGTLCIIVIIKWYNCYKKQYDSSSKVKNITVI
jgi:hypothetical protein